jgi:hypothetical protein
MDSTAEVSVTLSEELLRHLSRRARELKIPIVWLVAGLVCDTLDNFGGGAVAGHCPTLSYGARAGALQPIPVLDRGP